MIVKDALRGNRDSRPVQADYSYDSLYRLRKADYSDTTPDAAFKYDQVGNRVRAETVVDGQAYLTDYQYDSLDRMTGEAIEVGGSGLASRSFTYDSVGNRLSQEVDASKVAGTEHRIDYDYDPLDRVKAMTSRGQTAGYEYDLSGNLVRLSYPNRVEARHSYDMASRLTELRNVRLPSQAALNYFKYGYDKINNRVSMREVMGLHQYGYDKLYRLTVVDYARYPDQAYSYDPSGNRLTLEIVGKDTQTYAYDPANKLLSVMEGTSKTDYTWDEAGNLKTKAQSSGGKTEYTFDGANRLAGAMLPSGQSLVYGYDTDGHRVYRKEGDEKTWFVFDGLSVVMELAGNRKAVAAIVPGISKTNLSYHIPVTEYYLYDGLGSVVMLTDVLGNPTQYYQYDVFGGTQNLKRDPFNKYRFVGLAHDDSVGLTYMNARWYDPRVGRFIGRDPIRGSATNPQTLNAYTYVSNQPLSLVDLSGLDAIRDEYYDRIARNAHKQGPNRGVEGIFADNESPEENDDKSLTSEEQERVKESARQMREHGYSEEADIIEEALRNGEIERDSSNLSEEERARTRNPLNPAEWGDPLIRVKPEVVSGDALEREKTLAHEARHVRQLQESVIGANIHAVRNDQECYDIETDIQTKTSSRPRR